MWNGIDKRRFPRAYYQCTIFIKRNPLFKQLKTCTENISIGGICVILNKELKAFSDVKLKLALEDGLPPVECNGRIVWTIKRDLAFRSSRFAYTREAHCDTGIEFIDLKEDDRHRIEKIVDTLTKGLDKHT